MLGVLPTLLPGGLKLLASRILCSLRLEPIFSNSNQPFYPKKSFGHTRDTSKDQKIIKINKAIREKIPQKNTIQFILLSTIYFWMWGLLLNVVLYSQ